MRPGLENNPASRVPVEQCRQRLDSRALSPAIPLATRAETFI